MSAEVVVDNLLPITLAGRTLPANAPAPMDIWSQLPVLFAGHVVRDLVVGSIPGLRTDARILDFGVAFNQMVVGWANWARWCDACNIVTLIWGLMNGRHDDIEAAMRATAMTHVRWARREDTEAHTRIARWHLALVWLVRQHRVLVAAQAN